MFEQKHIVLFDGDCNFCNYWVNYVIKRDKSDVFRFASLQSEAGKKMLEEYQIKDDLETVVLIHRHQAKTKSTAALYIYMALGWPYKLVAPLLVVPKFIRDGVYTLVAKNRKRMMKSESCMISTEAVKAKFIT